MNDSVFVNPSVCCLKTIHYPTQIHRNSLTFTVEEEVVCAGAERAADEATAEIAGQTAAVKRACGVSTETQHAVINIHFPINRLYLKI